MSDTDILSRIQILLDANTASFETGMRAARETATTSFDQISSHAKGMATVVAGALTAGKFIEAADGYTQIGARIKRATDDAEEYAMVQARILETANQTFRPLVEAQETYLATSAGLKEMGKTTSEALDIIDSLSYAYTMNAASAEQVASANDWLAKSMIDNKVSGDAFKSMTLAADNLIQDLADHTGKSTVEIKKLGNAGKISLKDLMDTLQKTVDQNKKLAAEMPNTWNDGLTAVENNFNAFVGKANETYEITGKLSGGLIILSEHMEDLAVVAAMAGAAYGTKKLIEYSNAIKASITQNIARSQALAVERQALVAGAAAELSRTSAIAANMQAQVAAAQAEALRLTGMQRLAFVERTLIPLQAQSALASQVEAAASRTHSAALGAETAATSRLAVAKRALMGLVGGPAGLIIMAASVAAGFAMMSAQSDVATDSLAQQTEQVDELAKKYEKLNAAQVLAESGKIQDEIAAQNHEIDLQINKLAMLALKNQEVWGIEALELYQDTLQDLKNGAISGSEAVERLQKNSKFSPEVLRTISDYVVVLDAGRESVKKKQDGLALLNKTFNDSKAAANNAADGIKNVAKESATAATAVFNLNDEIDKLFKQADSNITAARITSALASGGADDKWIGIVNKYAQVEGAITKNAEGRAVFHDEILQKMRAEYAAITEQDKAVDARNKKEQERTKILEQQSKIMQVNSKVQANAAKYNFSGIEKKYGLLPGLLSGIHMQESGGNGAVVGPKTKYGTAKGGFQFLDDTAKRFGLKGDDVFDIAKSADAAGQYLQYLHKMFGSWEKAISAYHAGEGNVQRGTGVGPINRQYVKNVTGYTAAASGIRASADFSVEDAMKAQDEYLQIQLQQAEKRKQIELDIADFEVRIRSDLNDRKSEIDSAGYDDQKAADLKAQYEQWAEFEIAIYRQSMKTKVDSYSDYLKSEEQLLRHSFAQRQFDVLHDFELTKTEREEASAHLGKQLQIELEQLQYNRDEQLLSSKSSFMKESEYLQARYDLEIRKIQQIKDEKLKAGLLTSAGQAYSREFYDKRDQAWANYQNVSADLDGTQEYLGIENEYLDREAAIQKARDYELISEQEQKDRLIEIERKYQQDRLKLSLSYGEQISGSATEVMGTLFGEQSAAYKVMFAAQKGFAIAQSMIAIQQGIAQASALPFPTNLPAMAAVAAQTASIISNIQAVGLNLTGQAHDGIDNVPREGTWLLDKGERVVDRRTNADLKDYLANPAPSTPVINVYTLPGEAADVSTNPDGSLDIHIRKLAEETFVNNMANPNSRGSKAMQQNYNVTRKN